MSELPQIDDPNPSFVLKTLFTIREEISGLKTSHDALNKRLLGNGQPGAIQEIETRIGTIEGDITNTRTRIAYFSGIAVGVSTIVGYLLKLFR